MKTKRSVAQNVEEYIARFPAEVRSRLTKVRAAIREVAPQAEELISYNIPSYKLAGTYLIYFAGFAKHIGMYPAPRTADKFKDELAKYGGGKGTVQFPHDRPLPISLIRRIVKFRAQMNQELAKTKAKAAKISRRAR